jgi:hypothetical protein
MEPASIGVLLDMADLGNARLEAEKRGNDRVMRVPFEVGIGTATK